MFRVRSPDQSAAQSRLLAGYLAAIGGFVNSAGFVLIGSFTSHVTGNVGRLAGDIASADVTAATAALGMIVAFFLGAFFASLGVESSVLGRKEKAVALMLLVEAALLVLFMMASRVSFFSARARGMDLNAAVLCCAMGMQNSLVTRLSGAVVRTTHLTGVVTDLGIELSRWFRWWRGELSRTLHVRLMLGEVPLERPNQPKIALLGVIAGAFSSGAIFGAIAVGHLHRNVMAIPAFALVLGALHALRISRRPPQ